MNEQEKLEHVVDEYLHWRKVNPHIKGGENYLKRLSDARTKGDLTHLCNLFIYGLSIVLDDKEDNYTIFHGCIKIRIERQRNDTEK